MANQTQLSGTSENESYPILEGQESNSFQTNIHHSKFIVHARSEDPALSKSVYIFSKLKYPFPVRIVVFDTLVL